MFVQLIDHDPEICILLLGFNFFTWGDYLAFMKHDSILIARKTYIDVQPFNNSLHKFSAKGHEYIQERTMAMLLGTWTQRCTMYIPTIAKGKCQ